MINLIFFIFMLLPLSSVSQTIPSPQQTPQQSPPKFYTLNQPELIDVIDTVSKCDNKGAILNVADSKSNMKMLITYNVIGWEDNKCLLNISYDISIPPGAEATSTSSIRQERTCSFNSNVLNALEKTKSQKEDIQLDNVIKMSFSAEYCQIKH